MAVLVSNFCSKSAAPDLSWLAQVPLRLDAADYYDGVVDAADGNDDYFEDDAYYQNEHKAELLLSAASSRSGAFDDEVDSDDDMVLRDKVGW